MYRIFPKTVRKVNKLIATHFEIQVYNTQRMHMLNSKQYLFDKVRSFFLG